MKKVEAESLGTVYTHTVHLENEKRNRKKFCKSKIAELAMRNKKGITLIALVITIIVLLILVGVSIVMLTGNNGILTQAQKAKLSTELSSYKEQLQLYKTEKQAENRDFIESSLTVGKENLTYNTQPTGETGNIKTVIPSIKNEYIDKVEIIKGSLLINTQDKNEIEIAKSLGIAANPYDIVNGELLSSNGNLLLMDETGTLTIPDSVTKIGKGAFANLDGLKTIVIPGTVKEIGANAFRNNKNLEKVIIQEGVETIGEGAFLYCKGLKEIKLPESLTKMGPKVFYLCGKLQEIEIPSKIEEVKHETFQYCNSLEKVTFRGENINAIGGRAFADTNIKSIILKSNLDTISETAFFNCKELITIDIEEKNKNFSYKNSILIDNNAQNIIFISSKAYAQATELTIPEGIKKFKTDISNLTKLTKLTIPSTVEEIVPNNLTPTINEIIINEENQNYKTYENCIYTKDDTKLVYCYSKDTDIKLTNNKTTIIGGGAFSGATKAQNIKLQDSIVTLQSSLFIGCNNIETIKIGKNVNTIAPMFKYRNYVGTVIIDSENPNYIVENNVLYTKNKEKLVCALYYIDGEFIVDNNVKEIGEASFYGQDNLTKVIIPNSVEKIENTFQFCGRLAEIEIPNSVKEIGVTAFTGSNNLTKIIIHNKKDSISGAPWGAVTGARAVLWEEN